MKRAELIEFLDEFLQINAILDYGPQGLQVESEEDEINRVALMVDVSIAGIQAAAEWEAEMMLVHHGIFWGATQRLAGALGKRVRELLKNGINLYAAHLALDAHQQVGNNAVLAHMFGIEEASWWGDFKGTPLGVVGSLANPMALNALVAQIDAKLSTTSRVLAHGGDTVNRLAVLSGFGADQVAEARRQGADAFVTGETSHANFWAAEDYGINVIFAGHYATETVGVKALGAHLSRKFGLESRFFDFPTGM